MLSIEYVPMCYYDAIIIGFDGNDGIRHNIIIDGGDYKSLKFCYTDRLKGKLQSIFEAGETIDLWIISHIDDDHIGGLVNFINDKDFFSANCDKLKSVWMNYGGEGDYHVQKTGEIGYNQGKELRDLLLSSGVRLISDVLAGLRLEIAGAVLTVVAPNETALKKYKSWWNQKEFMEVVATNNGQIAAKDCDYDKAFSDFDENTYNEDSSVTNGSSIAVVFTYHDKNYLFAADSCSSILKEGLISQGFVQEGKVHLTQVHVPHHGSCRNTSKELLDIIDCDRYVITGDGRNRYHLPNKETIARLLKTNTKRFTLFFPNHTPTIDCIFKGEGVVDITLSADNKYFFD